MVCVLKKKYHRQDHWARRPAGPPIDIWVKFDKIYYKIHRLDLIKYFVRSNLRKRMFCFTNVLASFILNLNMRNIRKLLQWDSLFREV